MNKILLIFFACLLLPLLLADSTCIPEFYQCSGLGWTQRATCCSPMKCVYRNLKFSQCVYQNDILPSCTMETDSCQNTSECCKGLACQYSSLDGMNVCTFVSYSQLQKANDLKIGMYSDACLPFCSGFPSFRKLTPFFRTDEKKQTVIYAFASVNERATEMNCCECYEVLLYKEVKKEDRKNDSNKKDKKQTNHSSTLNTENTENVDNSEENIEEIIIDKSTRLIFQVVNSLNFYWGLNKTQSSNLNFYINVWNETKLTWVRRDDECGINVNPIPHQDTNKGDTEETYQFCSGHKWCKEFDLFRKELSKRKYVVRKVDCPRALNEKSNCDSSKRSYPDF